MARYHVELPRGQQQFLPSPSVTVRCGFGIAIRLPAAILAAAVHKSDGVRLQGELFWPCFLRENLR